MTKRINKILWHGTEIPKVASKDGATDGLNRGEVYIYDEDNNPTIYVQTDRGNVKPIIAKVSEKELENYLTTHNYIDKSTLETGYIDKETLTETGENLSGNTTTIIKKDFMPQLAGKGMEAKDGLLTLKIDEETMGYTDEECLTVNKIDGGFIDG